MFRFLVGLSAMLAIALAACGGGGGNDGPQPALVFSPASLAANYAAGTSATLTVRATATDPAAFSGTLYVVVADPNQVLSGTVNLSPISNSTYSATLYTSATAVGRVRSASAT